MGDGQITLLLMGKHFTVITDHSSLQWLLDVHRPGRLQRWAIKLSEFDFTIQYRKGKLNAKADYLSRSYQTEPKGDDLGFCCVTHMMADIEEEDDAFEQERKQIQTQEDEADTRR